MLPFLMIYIADLWPGFQHVSLPKAPATGFVNPTWSTTVDLDYAGKAPTNIVRIGNGDRCVYLVHLFLIFY